MENIKPRKKAKDENFDNSLKRLEFIAQEMENADLDLDKSLALFNEGMQLIKSCSQKLNEVKKKIEIITENGERKNFEN